MMGILILKISNDDIIIVHPQMHPQISYRWKIIGDQKNDKNYEAAHHVRQWKTWG